MVVDSDKDILDYIIVIRQNTSLLAHRTTPGYLHISTFETGTINTFNPILYFEYHWNLIGPSYRFSKTM